MVGFLEKLDISFGTIDDRLSSPMSSTLLTCLSVYFSLFTDGGTYILNVCKFTNGYALCLCSCYD